MKKYLILLFLITESFGQFQIRGRVLDRSTHVPVSYATISIISEKTGTVASREGEFNLDLHSPTRGTISVSSVGYENRKIDFEITETDPKIFLEILLTTQVIRSAPIIVRASRLPQSVDDIPASVQIISQKDIESHSNQTLGDLLVRSGAYNIRQYGGGGTQTLSLRGSNSDHIVVLVDGQRLNSAQMQTIDLSLFSAADIEQVEIYKGGYSALYGSEAVGGIIQIITKSIPLHSQSQFSTQAGSYGLSSNQARVGTRLGPVGFSLSFLDEQAKNNFGYQLEGYRGIRNNNDWTRQNVQLKAQYNSSVNRWYQVNAIYGRMNRGTPGTVNFEHPDAHQQDEMLLFQLVENRLVGGTYGTNGTTLLKTQINYRELKRGYQDPLIPVDSKQNNDDFGVTQELSHSFKTGRWVTGWEAEKEKINSTDLGDRARDHYGVFSLLEHTYPFSGLWLNEFIATPAIRLDGYSNYRNRISPKMGLVWRRKSENDQQVGLRISYGKNYRMPSFDDLYWPGAGNSHLKPETSWNWDAGIFSSWNFFGSITGEVNYFHNVLKNKIEWQPSPANPNLWFPQNITDALTEGIELSGKWESPHQAVSTRVNYIRQKVIDKTATSSTYGKTLIYQPRELFNSQLRIQLNEWILGITARYSGYRFFDSQNSPENFLPEYWITDLDAGKHIKWGNLNMEIRGSIENLFDQNYQLIYLYPMPGRLWKMSLQLKND